MWLCSHLLTKHGFKHAFTTRCEGVSTGAYASLNLGFDVGDDAETVCENRARFMRKLGVAPAQLFELRQVQGSRVHELPDDGTPDIIAKFEGDVLIARTSGLGVSVRTADCVPVLIADCRTGHVAAVHAGWRGAVAGVVPLAIDALGGHFKDLIVALGPHIRVDAFEISEEVATRLEQVGVKACVVDRSFGKPHGDMRTLIEAQLFVCGVSSARVEDVGGCTYQQSDLFFSHRRDAGQTGRHLSVIVARSS